MSDLTNLSGEDFATLGQCLRACADGPFFPDWEFATLFGFECDHVAALASTWPAFADHQEAHAVVTSVLNNLLGYPHGVEGSEWSTWIPATQGELRELLTRLT